MLDSMIVEVSVIYILYTRYAHAHVVPRAGRAAAQVLGNA